MLRIIYLGVCFTNASLKIYKYNSILIEQYEESYFPYYCFNKFHHSSILNLFLRIKNGNIFTRKEYYEIVESCSPDCQCPTEPALVFLYAASYIPFEDYLKLIFRRKHKYLCKKKFYISSKLNRLTKGLNDDDLKNFILNLINSTKRANTMIKLEINLLKGIENLIFGKFRHQSFYVNITRDVDWNRFVKNYRKVLG